MMTPTQAEMARLRCIGAAVECREFARLRDPDRRDRERLMAKISDAFREIGRYADTVDRQLNGQVER